MSFLSLAGVEIGNTRDVLCARILAVNAFLVYHLASERMYVLLGVECLKGKNYMFFAERMFVVLRFRQINKSIS